MLVTHRIGGQGDAARRLDQQHAEAGFLRGKDPECRAPVGGGVVAYGCHGVCLQLGETMVAGTHIRTTQGFTYDLVLYSAASSLRNTGRPVVASLVCLSM